MFARSFHEHSGLFINVPRPHDWFLAEKYMLHLLLYVFACVCLCVSVCLLFVLFERTCTQAHHGLYCFVHLRRSLDSTNPGVAWDLFRLRTVWHYGLQRCVWTFCMSRWNGCKTSHVPTHSDPIPTLTGTQTRSQLFSFMTGFKYNTVWHYGLQRCVCVCVCVVFLNFTLKPMQNITFSNPFRPHSDPRRHKERTSTFQFHDMF